MEVDPLTTWKAAAQAGSPPADARLIKSYTADHIKFGDAADDRTAEFTISTQAVDRDGDTVAVDGWDVADYLKNPVVLWAHNSRQPPIGRSLALVQSASALKAKAEFMKAEMSQLADTVFRMLKGGWLRAVSVGFMPKGRPGEGFNWNEQRGGVDFLKQTLLEFSVCPVPSNPECLMGAKHAGIDLAPLKGWAEQTLDALSDEPGLWLPRSVAEKALRVLEPKASVSVPALPSAADVALPEKAEPFALELRAEPRYQITQAEVREALTAAAKDIVRDELRRHTGRLD